MLEDGYDFAYIHVEAPDEMGHQGSVEKKVQAIEYLDGRVIKPLTEKLDREGIDYRLLVLPDHSTTYGHILRTAFPICCMTAQPLLPKTGFIMRRQAGIAENLWSRAIN